MKRLVVIALLAINLPLSAFAQTTKPSVADIIAKINGGNYFYTGVGYINPAEVPPFRVIRQGGEFRFLDNKNKIPYALDPTLQTPQSLHPKFFTFHKTEPRTKSIAQTLKDITVENLRVGKKENTIDATIKIQIEYVSKFGTVTAELQCEGSIEVATVPLTSYSTGTAVPYQATAIKYTAGSGLKLTEFSTSIRTFDKPLGLLLDLLIRLGSLNAIDEGVIMQLK
jgi:hypothetical protein